MMARRKKFPTLAVIVLLFAIFWLLKELNIFRADVPWLPVILLVIAVGWIVNAVVR